MRIFLVVTRVVFSLIAIFCFCAACSSVVGSDRGLMIKETDKGQERRMALYAAVAANDTAKTKELLAVEANPNFADNDGRTLLFKAVFHGREEMVNILVAAGVKPDAKDKDGQTALCFAARDGQPAMVKALLAARANPDILCGKDGETALHAAAHRGGLESVKLLLAAKANPNAISESRWTPLLEAISPENSDSDSNRVEIVSALLAARADPNFAPKGALSPLCRAAATCGRGKNKDGAPIVKALLAAKANANARCDRGRTPLYYAAQRGSLDAVRLLLAAKADPNAVDENGESALDVASYFDNPDVESVLKKAGAKSKKSDDAPLYDELGRPMNMAAAQELQDRRAGKESKPRMHILLYTEEQANVLNETIAQEKAGKKSEYLTRAVLLDIPVNELAERVKAGQNVNAVDPVFGRPLFQAIEQRRNVAVIKFLLDHGADPNEGRPLLTALVRDIPYSEATSLLLAAGANPKTVDDNNTPVLTLAAQHGDAKSVSALLKANAPVDALDKNGKTAIYYAIDNHGREWQEVVSLLLDSGASPAAFPALLVLEWKPENVEMALLLLKKGASGAVISRWGSLLHWAIRDNSLELLAAALAAKAPLDARDQYDWTALYLAVQEGKADFVTALLRAGAPVNRSTFLEEREYYDNRLIISNVEDDMLPRAVKKGNEEVIKALIAGKVALNSRENDEGGRTALCKAIDQGLSEIVKIVLAAGAKPDVPDNDGRTPLHHAVSKKDMESLTALLAAKANPNVRDKDGETPLYLAAKKGLADMVKALLAAGAVDGK